jgi:hypothetical protein
MIAPTETDYIIFGARRCLICETELPACGDFFVADGQRPGGIRGICRDCRAEQERARHTPEKRARKRAWQRAYRARKKGAVAA